MSVSRAEEIQVLYEIAIAIGEGLELKQMLRSSLLAFLRKLNCSAGGIIFLSEGPPDYFSPKILQSIPRNLEATKAYKTVKKVLPVKLTQQEKDIFSARLPIWGKTKDNSFYYCLNIDPWGILLLVKGGNPLSSHLIHALSPLVRKLSQAIGFCFQNADLWASLENLRRAQNDLAKSETRLQAILDTAPDGIILENSEKEVISLNPAALKLFGYKTEKIIGQPLKEFFETDYSKEHGTIYRKGIRENGSSFPIDVTVGEINLGDQIIRTNFVRDVTERTQKEEIRIKQALDLKERVKELACLYGISKLFSDTRAPLSRIMQKAVELIPPSWQYPDLTSAEIIFDDQKYHTSNLKKSSQFLKSDILVNRSKRGELKVYCRKNTQLKNTEPFLKEEKALIQAITQRLGTFLEHREAEEAKRRTEERYRHLFESMGDFLVVHDLKGNILTVNPTVTQSLGYTKEEMEGKPISNFIPPKFRDIFYEKYLPTIHKKRAMNGTMLLVGKDGTHHTIEYRNSFMRQEDGTYCISGVGRDITVRLKNQRLMEKARKRELEIGAKIQRELLLGNLPQNLDGANLAALTVPSQGIDGDFYNFIQHSDKCFDFIIGDIMGKGVAAALLGAAAKSEFEKSYSHLMHKTITQNLPPIADILTWINKRIVEKLMGLESFMTLCYCRIDLDLKSMEFIDCGHTRLIHYKGEQGKCRLLSGENMPLGFSDKDEYQPVAIDLKCSDMFLFYSDGITEAMNAKGELFSEERLVRVVEKNSDQGPEHLIDAVKSKVMDFCQSEVFSDDLTCVALEIGSLSPAWLVEEKTFPANLDNLSDMRLFLHNFLDKVKDLPFDKQNIFQLELACHEACANVVKHAYKLDKDKTYKIVLELFPSRLVITILHNGIPFDPTTVKPPPLDGSQDHGLGLYLIQKSMDSLRHEITEKGEKAIILTKYPGDDYLVSSKPPMLTCS